MKGGILEVLLVSAEGIRHTNILGTGAYYVIVQCGAEVHSSKLSSGKDEEICWNQKFMFDFPLSEWIELTNIKFKIMNKEFFSDDGFVGQTIVHLSGIITEGIDKGFIELKPAPYNVVLKDDTYKGEIKIGFKFIANKGIHKEMREFVAEEEQRQSMYRSIINLWKVSWWRFLFVHNKTYSKSKEK